MNAYVMKMLLLIAFTLFSTGTKAQTNNSAGALPVPPSHSVYEQVTVVETGKHIVWHYLAVEHCSTTQNFNEEGILCTILRWRLRSIRNNEEGPWNTICDGEVVTQDVFLRRLEAAENDKVRWFGYRAYEANGTIMYLTAVPMYNATSPRGGLLFIEHFETIDYLCQNVLGSNRLCMNDTNLYRPVEGNYANHGFNMCNTGENNPR